MTDNCTKSGLQKLARIVRQARGNASYREFEALLSKKLAENNIRGGKVPHATIRRLELSDFAPGSGPDYETLSKIACILPYTVKELLAIVSESELSTEHEEEPEFVRSYRVAEDVLPLALELPRCEIARLGQMLFAKLENLTSDSH